MWTNGPLVVYHGTDEQSALSIMSGIDLKIGPPSTDLGRGFYVTSIFSSAKYWANQKVRRSSRNAAVLTFQIERDTLAELDDHLAFCYATDDFYDFVELNRASPGNPNHARSGKDPKSGTVLAPCYDLVYSPVSEYPLRQIRFNADQICFLTDKAIKCLSKPIGPVMGTPLL
jgi:hypothetical protein